MGPWFCSLQSPKPKEEGRRQAIIIMASSTLLSSSTTSIQEAAQAVGEDVSPPFHRRLHTIRNKLLVLDYREPLSVDSLDLVEHLFGDLVTTSESFERLQQREDRLSHDLALAQVIKADVHVERDSLK